MSFDWMIDLKVYIRQWETKPWKTGWVKTTSRLTIDVLSKGSHAFIGHRVPQPFHKREREREKERGRKREREWEWEWEWEKGKGKGRGVEKD